jgi:CHAT domain-containing protein/Tfp pilus assembly protein PilF
MGDTSGLVRILSDLGYLHLAQGHRAEAMEDYLKSLKLSDAIGDKSLSAYTLTSIGYLYEYGGNGILALEHFQRALKIREALGEKSLVASILITIGDLHRSQGNAAQALEYFQTALKIAKETGNQEVISNAIGGLGNVQYSFGNYTRALEYHQESLRILEEAGMSNGIWICLYNIGLLHQLQGNMTLALDYHQRSLKLCEKKGDKEGIATSLYGIASVYFHRGEYSQAVDVASRGIAVSLQGGPVSRLGDLYSLAGRAYRGLDKSEPAHRSFADAIAVVEERRGNTAGGTIQQQLFLAKESSPYYDIVDLLVSQQNVVDAFAFSERVKGRALLDILQSGRESITRAMTPSDREEERKLNGEVNSLNIQITRERVREQPDQAKLVDLDARIQKARLEQERFEINLYAAHPELKVHRGQMQPLSVDQAGKLIPDKGTALLEYVVGEKTIQLFVLTKSAGARVEQSTATPILKVYTLNIDQRDLTERVRKFRGRLANQDFLFHEPARELYELLLGPARAELQGKTNLIIVPDGILWELPFQALQPAPKRFLVENCAISYAPSLTVLLEMARAHSTVANTSTRLLAFGNPAIGKQTTERINSVHMDERLDPLPEAERQVKELARLYGPSRCRIYIGAEAQEARVKAEAGGYGILHLAAHGILNDKNPMYSQVVLSQPEGDTTEDGMLEAWEVMKLDLKADLVVLSACDTARGKVGNGEGMVGLAWSFFVAGVPATVASQWSVDAASTTELMVGFHRNLERHKGKAESLRQAMLKLLNGKKYNHPFYWAGFVVVGDGR